MTTSTKPFVKGYKFRIYPNKDQIDLLEKTFGCCRFVWNKALAEAKQEQEFYLAHKDIGSIKPVLKPNVTGFGFVNRLIGYKNNPDTQWLNEVNSVALQQVMLHLGAAYSEFFKKRKGYPKFKKKYNHQSFSLMNNSFRFKEGSFYIAKSKDPLKINFSRELPSAPTSAVISKTPSGSYYISFVCRYFPKKTNGKGKIGIDLGIKDFLVDSNGNRFPNPKYLEKKEKQLARYQRAMSRKKKGSQNRNKTRLKVAELYEKITNQRNDFLHKLSRKLINENQVIGVEKLKVKNMVKNHKLAKAISSASWSRFCEMLNYKSKESQNCSIVYMDTYFPSTHICNATGIKLDYKLKLSDRTWKCPHCGETHDRDLNAARNIRDETLLTLVLHKVPDGAGIIVLAERQ
jgi:putative transposase